MSEALSHIGAQVRAADPDRFYAALFAPAEKREALFALLAFNHEVARVREIVSQGVIGQMRLAWWHEALAEIESGKPARAHPVVTALETAHRAYPFSLGLLDALLDARSFDLYDDPMPDLGALERYAEATSGGLHRAMAQALGADEVGENACEAVGTAWALTGIVRALRIHASRGQLYLPLRELTQRGIVREAVFAGEASDGLRNVIGEVIALAKHHLTLATGKSLKDALPAAMMGTLLQPMWGQIAAHDFDPFRAPVEISAIKRMYLLLLTGLRGQI